MAESELDLFEVQVGKETTWGTVVAPTAKLMGIESCEIVPLQEAEHIPEMRGDLTPAYNAIVNRFTGEANIEGTITYEDICYFLDSLLGEATPSGAGPYVYSYAGPGAKPTPRVLTLVKGDSEGVYSLAGGLVDTLELTFEKNTRSTFSAHLLGKLVNTDTLASLSDRSVNIAHGNQVALYIDPFGTAAGTTVYSGIKIKAGLSLDMNRQVKEGLGSLNPVGWKQQKADPGANQMTFSLEFDSTSGLSKDMLDALIGATSTPFEKVVRLLAQIDSNHILQVDFAGFSPEAPSMFSDEDGIATVEFTLNAIYESTLANWLKIDVTNQVSTLP